MGRKFAGVCVCVCVCVCVRVCVCGNNSPSDILKASCIFELVCCRVQGGFQ